jgi:hypothetical protein
VSKHEVVIKLIGVLRDLVAWPRPTTHNADLRRKMREQTTYLDRLRKQAGRHEK